MERYIIRLRLRFPPPMPVADLQEARSLLQGPPSYESHQREREIEQLEIEDPPEMRNHLGWLSKMSRFGSQRIYRPVKQVIDPITSLWKSISAYTEAEISKYVHILLVKRILFLAFMMSIIGSIYYFHSDSLLGHSFEHINHKLLVPQLRDMINLDSIKAHTDYFNRMPHYAGSSGDKSTRDYVYEYFNSLGLNTKLDRHEVFLSYGKDLLMELKIEDKVVYTSNLQEPMTLNKDKQLPRTSMPLSLPGECESRLIYANFGSKRDLTEIGDSVNGALILVKYSKEDPGSVALRLEKFGACGVLFFSENSTPLNGASVGASFPEGSNYPNDAIEQRQLGFSYLYPGDILSPGWPDSMKLQTSLQTAHIAHIPAAAISWDDASQLLNAIKGKGQRKDSWHNNGKPENVNEFWTGQSNDVKIHLKVDQTIEQRHQIANVIGSMKGREQASQIVVIGTRLDSVCLGGSSLSGLTVMLEVAKALANLKFNNKWEPLRTILFTVWDGTSQNYAGSTEWVETVAEDLYHHGIAYIDLDLGISGPDFVVQNNPVLNVVDILKETKLNDSFSLFDAVDQTQSFVPISGSGNYLAFDPHTGVPSIKLGFTGKSAPLDSCYDNADFMAAFGDPDFSRHRALADSVLNLALSLADDALLPYDFENLSNEIKVYTGEILNEIKDTMGDEAVHLLDDAAKKIMDGTESLKRGGGLYKSILSDWNTFASNIEDKDTGYVSEGAPVTAMRRYWNDNIERICKLFLDRNGIPSRNWYKNHLFGPAYDYVPNERYSGTLPAVRDSLRHKDVRAINENLRDLAAHIDVAGNNVLKMIARR